MPYASCGIQPLSKKVSLLDLYTNNVFLLNNNDKVLSLTACDDFTYGDNCSSTCGACRGLTSCDKETGLCAEGCEPEFVGQLCLGKLITSKHCYSKQALNEFKFYT